MNRQTHIDQYYKSCLSPVVSKTIMNIRGNSVQKKRNLSLIKPNSPAKLLKVNEEAGIVNLCSDEEELESPEITCSSETAGLCRIASISPNSSQSTIVYSLSPKTPIIDVQAPDSCDRTTTPSSSAIKIKSPNSINKWYSPTKKKVVFRRNPVKRNLASELNNDSMSSQSNQDFKRVDDKTTFFIDVINKVLGEESLKNLLDVSTQSLATKCLSIMKPAQTLLCRLYWCKEGWYKKEKLKNILLKNCLEVDDGTTDCVLKEMSDIGILISFYGQTDKTFDDYAELLGADELKKICKHFKLKFSKKSDALEKLREFSKQKSILSIMQKNSSDNSQRVLQVLKQNTGQCYKLSENARSAIHKLYMIMYLGMDYSIIRDKKLEFTLINVKTKRESYPVDNVGVLDNASLIFKNIDEFERFISAHSDYEHFFIIDESAKLNEIIKAFDLYKQLHDSEMLRCKGISPWLLRFTPLYFYVKIMDKGIQHVKKENDYTVALDILTTLISQDLFRQHRKTEWFNEKALVLEKCKKYNEAASILLQAFKSDFSDEAKDVLRKRAKLVAKRISDNHIKEELLMYSEEDTTLENTFRSVHVYKQPMERTKSKGKLKFEIRKENETLVVDVEDYGLYYYTQIGEFTNGKHWEGRIVITIFFLLFWDIIYSKPPGCSGVFLSSFQKFPLDLFYDSFYSNRRESIDCRLSQIERMNIEDILGGMNDIWTSRPENEHSGLNMNIKWEEIRSVSECLGARALAAICRRLATNYQYACTGFPDLTLWTSPDKIRFVEVKSDSDTSSMKQIQWMRYLKQNDIDTEFCYIGVNTERNKSRAALRNK